MHLRDLCAPISCAGMAKDVRYSLLLESSRCVFVSFFVFGVMCVCVYVCSSELCRHGEGCAIQSAFGEPKAHMCVLFHVFGCYIWVKPPVQASQ